MAAHCDHGLHDGDCRASVVECGGAPPLFHRPRAPTRSDPLESESAPWTARKKKRRRRCSSGALQNLAEIRPVHEKSRNAGSSGGLRSPLNKALAQPKWIWDIGRHVKGKRKTAKPTLLRAIPSVEKVL